MNGSIQADYFVLIPFYNPGVSAESETLASIHDEFNYEVSITSFGQKMLSPLTDLEEVFIECLDEGWDGYDARPVSIAAYTDALNFLRILPMNYYTPDIVPEPSGGIGLEWISDDNERFVISFDGSGTYAYAGIFLGGSRVRGIESLGHTLPKMLRDFITRLFS